MTAPRGDLLGNLSRTPAPPPVLTVAEVAWRLQVSKMTVYRLIHDEQLAAYRVGRSFRVPERGFESYLARAASGGEG